MPATHVPKSHIEPSYAMTGTGHTAVILCLMSHHLRSPCPLLVRAIAGRLACLSHACGDSSAAALYRLADALLPQWRNTLICIRH